MAAGGATEPGEEDLEEVVVEPVEDRVESAPEEVGEAPLPEELVPFGFSLFESSPDSYRQPAFGPVDPEYPLGPGDEIVLDVWGDTVFRIVRELDREGGVNLPEVGRVVLAGMTLEEVRKSLRRQLSRFYSGLAEEGGRATTHMSVTLGNLRMIRVFVVGRTRRPGGYDLSAASTVFHALFFAGGPTLEGSLRDIRVIRGGKEIAVLDVYEYLRTGRREGDVRLENDDTVFIPPTGPRVTVRGEIRQPAIYETLPGETLRSVLETAGGFTQKAFEGRIQIDRILDPEEQEATGEDRKLLDISYDRSESEAMRDGDVVTVFPIADRLGNFVSVLGEIRRPGTYEHRPRMRLSEALTEAGGLLETAFQARAEVIRTYENREREQFSVDLRHVLAGDLSYDLKLEPRDEIRVYSIWELQDEWTVSVFGAVRNPGRFELRANMTLEDLLLQAGGTQDWAYLEEVEISRVRPDEADRLQTAEIFRVPLGEDYLSREEGTFRLEPFDNVFVREKPYYELQRNVEVRGEVRFPGVYTLRSPLETLTEVLERAGGLKETAYPEGFTLVRKKDAMGRVALDLPSALKRPGSKHDVVLFAGDSLHVPEEPKTVKVTGAVGYPTSLVYDAGWSLGDYIDHAGGTTDLADERQVRIVYSTGAAARVKRFWFDPEVRPGSTIVVPEREQTSVDWGKVIRNATSVLASIATVALVADKVAKLAHTEEESHSK